MSESGDAVTRNWTVVRIPGRTDDPPDRPPPRRIRKPVARPPGHADPLRSDCQTGAEVPFWRATWHSSGVFGFATPYRLSRQAGGGIGGVARRNRSRRHRPVGRRGSAAAAGRVRRRAWCREDPMGRLVIARCISLVLALVRTRIDSSLCARP
jgi:hypothetical protein